MKKIFSLIALGIIFSSALASATLIDNIVSYYTLDSSSGTTAIDSLGYNNLTVGTALQWISGIINNAYNITGIETIQTGKNYTLYGNMTLNFWIRRTGNLPVSSTLISSDAFDNPPNNNGWRLYPDTTTTLTFNFNSGGLNSKVSPRLNQWEMLTYIQNSSGYFSYYNGALNGTSANTGYTNWALVLFGNTGNGLKFANATIDEIGVWNRSLAASEISQLYNSGNGLQYSFGVPRVISLLTSPSNGSSAVYSSKIFNSSATFAAVNVTNATFSLWYLNGTLVNTTFIPSINPSLNATSVNFTNLQYTTYLWNAYWCANNASNNSTCSWAANNFTYSRGLFLINSILAPLNTSTGNTFNITANITLSGIFSNAILTFNNTNSTPNVMQDSSGNYILTSQIQAPFVTSPVLVNYSYFLDVAGISSQSSIYNITVTPVYLNTTCAGGSFLFVNITNFDEETLKPLNGTVEYTLLLQNSNGSNVGLTNGTITGMNVSICSSQNLTSSGLIYSLQLRYYGNTSTTVGYAFETYNIIQQSTSAVPFTIPLYFELNTSGTEFIINYLDFNYLTHPGAVIQIQRQYLSQNVYNVVEAPLIGNNGLAQGVFNTNNVRYKILVTQNGQLLDSFDNVFPACQNLVLGQCQINLRGVQQSAASSSNNFIYSLVNQNNSLILTYTIPNGVPESVTFQTVQNSPFLNGISSCNTTVFGSGGTITCGYNNTVGNSIVSVEVDINGAPFLFGSIPIAQDNNSIFLGNNYFIAFVLLLTLILIFISSGQVMLIIDGVGTLFLGLVFLIKGVSVGTIATSVGWLIVAIIITVYHINQHEEKYI